MTAPVLRFSGVGKRYATYRSSLPRIANWFGAGVAPHAEHWSLTDVSFEVGRSESIALIGPNGAGKSTLLKIATGTVRPTRGSVTLDGTLTAILELGLGFNPEFTGRQNVHHAGGLMGFKPGELAALMPEVEAFAEIGAFFDEPLRIYSSGMQARLAFALATARRPDVLVVDEVLAVGDAYFQHKCFDRIRGFKKDGTSIVLVTHAMGDVRALSDRVVLLDAGRVAKIGLPDEVVDHYNALIAAKENSKLTIEQRRDRTGWLHTRSGDYTAVIRSIDLRDGATQNQIATATVGQQLMINIEVEVRQPVAELVLGLMIRDRSGHVVWGGNTWHTGQLVKDVRAGELLRFDFTFACDLGPGSFSVSTALHPSATHLAGNYEWQDNALVFDVVNVGVPFFIGTNRLTYSFSIQR